MDVERRVRRLLAAHVGCSEKHGLDTQLSLDSLAEVELQLELEEAFGIRLADGATARCRTPRDYIRLVETYLD